ncbi:hypothetical protein BT69DRAFT_1333411 [Atractiella rhizophila]|nr:hypothetical protein BT69DRAFT_1333411 [Atractiella rhizophila]
MPSSKFLSSRPEFKANDERLGFLYSAFPSRKSANPDGYAQAVEWWKGLLCDLAWEGGQSGKGEETDRLILNVDEKLREVLRWDGIGAPSALGEVVRSMARSRVVIPLPVFNSTPSLSTLLPSTSATRSISSTLLSTLVAGPLSWAFSQLNPFASEDDSFTYDDEDVFRQCKGSYVIVSNLEKTAKIVCAKLAELAGLNVTERLFTREEWKKKFGIVDGKELSQRDLEVLMKYLQRDQRVLVMDRGVVKILSSLTLPSTSRATEGISTEERGILELKQSSNNLTQQISDIESRISQQTAKIEKYLKAKQKSMALSYLRSRKQLEALLLKRTGTLETVTSVLLSIERATGDVEIMRMYDLGSKTLKSLLAHPSLSPDKVDETMESLSETLADQKEIDDAIGIGGDLARRSGVAEEIDDDELKKELEMLEEEVKGEEKKVREKERDREEAEKRRVEEDLRLLKELKVKQMEPDAENKKSRRQIRQDINSKPESGSVVVETEFTVDAGIESQMESREFKGNDERLGFLYSAFPSRKSANPDGYAQAVAWWKGLLCDLAWEGGQSGKGEETDRLILNVDEKLREVLRWDGIGTPSALGEVVRSMARSRVVIPLPVFNSTPSLSTLLPSTSATRSISSTLLSTLVAGPLSWAFSQLNPFASEDDSFTYDDEDVFRQCKGSYVIVSNLEKTAKIVCAKLAELAGLNVTERLFTREEWKKKFGIVDGKELSQRDLEVLMKYLQRDQRVLVMDRGVVKILSSLTLPSTSRATEGISTEERGILELKQSSNNLTQQISDIEIRISQQTAKIEKYLKAKQKSMALSYLRSRKQLEALLLKRTGTLETVTSVLLSIERATGDVEIMRVYDLGSKTLKSLLAHPSLSPDKVDETMESLSETLADQKEIDDAIGIGGDLARRSGGAEEIDDDELKKELEMLEEEVKGEEKKVQEKERDREEAEKRRVEEDLRLLKELKVKQMEPDAEKDAERRSEGRAAAPQHA